MKEMSVVDLFEDYKIKPDNVCSVLWYSVLLNKKMETISESENESYKWLDRK